MNIKKQIKKDLKKVLDELNLPFDLVLEINSSSNPLYGDYTTNIAMVIFSSSKFKVQSSKFGNARELAEEIVTKFKSQNSKVKGEVAGPGFINFWLSNELLITQLDKVLNKREEIVLETSLKNKKIMVEFAQPNTHKEFHIGHLRNIVIGESISRLLEFLKAKVFRANFQGDIGLHVAKAIYGIMNYELRIKNKKLEEIPLEERIKVLGEAYAEGSKAYEEDEKAKEKILEINKSLYLKEDKYQEIYKKTRQWSLDYFDKIYQRLYTRFDRLFFESEVYEKGKETVEKNMGKVFKKDFKDQGAVIFDGEPYGFHKRVFITKEGNPTYEGKDMGLASLEYSTFPFDLNVHVVAQEQAGYFQVIFKALELIDEKFKNKEKHLSYGMVELKEGKMSSRKGNVLTANWLLDEAKNRIKKEFPEMDEETAEKVAVGAVKYSMLKFSSASNISFSFEESINLEGNSGPYLQYTYARTRSVLARIMNYELRIKNFEGIKLEGEEENLLRVLAKFDETVVEAGENYAPNVLAAYLYDLAKHFNLFYQKCPILKGDSVDFRVALTKTTGEVLKQGLNLLGIESPEKM
ncbi:arginine--tRNA ligase [Patescibacteria group bacterium]|nr:arginine--tRNA ligase [Patescibacteria group bacterium]